MIVPPDAARAFNAYLQEAVIGNAGVDRRQQRAELAEIAALKKEVAKLKAERDILKKAAAFFAREAT